MERSLSHFNLANFANTIIPTGFLYSRFPTIAAVEKALPYHEELNTRRLYRFHKKQSMKEPLPVIDKPRCFYMWPYGEDTFAQIWSFFSHEARAISAVSEELVNEDPSLIVVLLFTPGYLPSYTDWGYSSEHYNPNRCS